MFQRKFGFIGKMGLYLKSISKEKYQSHRKMGNKTDISRL
jgi:hypothetical protein